MDLLYIHHMRICLSFIICFLSLSLSAQTLDEQLRVLNSEKDKFESLLSEVNSKIEGLKAQKIIKDLKAFGLPSENYIEHSAMILEYAEAHEQAKWVAHIILPDVATGKYTRTNDFRADPKVSSKTAEEFDYFLKMPKANGDTDYDGFGYDRGHLAPSADFNWSAQAISESYFYSNMSPQVEELNQKSWAKLEYELRNYVKKHETPLYVITAPVLSDKLAKSPRATNHLTVPQQYVKAVYDAKNNRAIGFIMPNSKDVKLPEYYAVTIDEVEAALGFDIFPKLDEQVESNIDKQPWLGSLQNGSVEPIYQPSMPPGHFNTVVGGQKVGKKVKVCGQVVGSNRSKKGNVHLNLDKRFPDHIFTIFISKKDLFNFDQNITEIYMNKLVCVEGTIEKYKENPPSVSVVDESAITIYRPAAN